MFRCQITSSSSTKATVIMTVSCHGRPTGDAQFVHLRMRVRPHQIDYLFLGQSSHKINVDPGGGNKKIYKYVIVNPPQLVLYGVHYPYSTWLGWANWFVARRATGSGAGCTFRPQLCNMYIALTAGSIWNILHRW